jgi:hypothetical protein
LNANWLRQQHTCSLRRGSSAAHHTPMLPAASTVDSPTMAAMMMSGTAGPSGGGSTPIMLVLSISTLASRKAIGSDRAMGPVAAARAVSRLRRWRSCANPMPYSEGAHCVLRHAC